jgi:hypothetical protein
MNSQDRYCQGLIASLARILRDGGGRDGRGDALGDGLGRQVRAAPPRQRHPGLSRQLAGQGFDLGGLQRCEAAGPSGSGPVLHPGHAVIGVSASPRPDGVDRHAVTSGDLGVGVAAGGVQHDPRPDDLLVGGGTGTDQSCELPSL